MIQHGQSLVYRALFETGTIFRRFLDLVDSPYNGLTFCTSSLGSNSENDLPAMIREFHDRIPSHIFAMLKFLKMVISLRFLTTVRTEALMFQK